MPFSSRQPQWVDLPQLVDAAAQISKLKNMVSG